jgi:hypothetical protein
MSSWNECEYGTPFNALTDQQNIDAEYSGCVPTQLSSQADDSVSCAWWVVFGFYSFFPNPPVQVNIPVGPFNESQLQAGVALNNWYVGRGVYISFTFKMS